MSNNKPSPRPDEGALESLDDLIKQQQQASGKDATLSVGDDGFLAPPPANPSLTEEQRELYNKIIMANRRRASSGGATIVPGDPRLLSELNASTNANNPGSSSSSDRGLADSSVTIRPQEPISTQRDESRWNGFHLWRAESYQRRVDQQHQLNRDRLDAQRVSPLRRIQRAVSHWFQERMIVSRNDDGSASISKTRMILLTLVLSGAQVAWCLELGYGTPYLLSLGMSKSSTSLVWIAAPLSGLIVQPVIGVLSDLSTSRYRRRQYIVWSTIVLAACTLFLAYSMPIASALTDILHAGLADWDPVRQRARDDMNRFIAVLGFVGLDLSVNGIQVAGRALMLDATPSSEHSRVNAWSGRMQHIANIFGYWAGWYNLSSSSWLDWIGGGQFRKYCLVSMVSVIVCSAITCLCIEEGIQSLITCAEEGTATEAHTTVSATSFQDQPSTMDSIKEASKRIWDTARRLPRSIRRICLVQVLAYMGWFPFLFYATEWVIEVWQAEQSRKGHHDGEDFKGISDQATELGSFALLVFSIVSLIAGTLLPYLSLAHWTPPPVRLPETDGNVTPTDEDIFRRLSGQAARTTKPPRWRVTLRTFWGVGLLFYSIQMLFVSFLARSSKLAIALVASIGFAWAIAVWVPYALVMEGIREAEDGMSPYEFEADWFAPERVRNRRESSTAQQTPGRARIRRALQDCGPLGSGSSPGTPTSSNSRNGGSGPRHVKPGRILSRGNEAVYENDTDRINSGQIPGGGVPVPSTQSGTGEGVGATILGIHNVAIVIPQFLIAILASLILRQGSIFEGVQELYVLDVDANARNGVSVVWVLRLGGLAALFAALLTRFVPLSRTERQLMGDRATLRQSARAESMLFDDEVSDESDLEA
ncbi:uncharacterized protein FA14DRAFT_160056 [Meira miltonrushii]|uniref:MFS general substrate transporter n=1 Tax=Meira miltonrushii TaxID=1280837 RepID=A0A316VQZ1_9BASI|nr:uncharacterized protein FA14DRAFT_160056 [Meira miltonrushii]PWN38591.1 hypothetical protein FA14DRAFT_160056 [Meira miltonrushii]